MQGRWLYLVFIVSLSLVAAKVFAGPQRQVGADVPADQRISINDIDHSAWDRLLRKYVDDRGGVNYQNWQASAADVQLLDGYLAHLSAASLNVPSARGAQLAYWINAYNAVTVKGILDEYPTSSIRNHTAKFVGYNIWHDLLLKVDGRELSLDTIEHKLLRKMNEPRIHFAIVCASISCPRLRNEAYTFDHLEQQLADNARHFFATPGNFRFDAAAGTFELSAILDWFGEDFGSSPAARLQAIAPYLPDAASQQAAQRGAGRTRFMEYNWGLNEQGKL